MSFSMVTLSDTFLKVLLMLSFLKCKCKYFRVIHPNYCNIEKIKKAVFG